MPPDRAERVADIVEDALEQPTDARRAFLDHTCAGDTALRREVESLLDLRKGADAFIEEPAFRIPEELLDGDGLELAPGQIVGSYRIRSLLGEGGMGEVYLADDTQLERQVALKLIKRGVSTRRLLRQFQHEERILAALTHPNIARLYGAGATADGLPFFVMEYVEGERLDRFVNARELPLADRLMLFRKVCAAVAYAHSHLVVHRDLKPANIRVAADGEPKLLDFGIAKLLDHETDATPERTMTLPGVMTPEYASPEQVRGEPVTTASDIYSLGVLLFELLTGEKPYRVTNHTPAEISRAIIEQQPQRPSTRRAKSVQSASGSGRSLRGDLDNIALMAMRKEPERRYPSVAQFAEDIERYLAGRPVRAHKDTLRYRAGKFVRRNRLGVAAAAAVLVTLIGGIITTLQEARIAEANRAKAEQRFADVRKLANSFLFEMHDAIEKLPGSTPARRLLVARGLEYLDKLSREAQGDASLQRELVQAYIRIGNVQGNPTNPNLGDTAGALASYAKAATIAHRLSGDDAASQRPLALTFEKTADVLAVTGEVQRAVRTARESWEIFHRIAAADPANANAQQSLAISHIKVGDLSGNPNFANAGDTAAALEHYRASLAIWEAQQKLDPSSTKVRRFLGIVHERIGSVLLDLNDNASAVDHLRTSLAIRQALAADDPSNTDNSRDAAIALEKIGEALTRAGELDAALDHRARSLAIFQQLATADPQNVFAQLSLAISHMHMAELLADPEAANLGRKDEALAHARAGLDILNAINSDKANAKTRATAGELCALIARME